jgi:hypothetical protein
MNRSKGMAVYSYSLKTRGTEFQHTLVVLGAFFALLPALRADDCAASQAALDRFLNAQPKHCSDDADCAGYYFGVDACAPPVVLAKPGISKAREPQLLKLQAEVRAACAKQLSQRPVCSPVSYLAKCRQERCVDTSRSLSSTPALVSLPAEKRSYPFAVIRHECGPADGPALGIYFSPSKASSFEVPVPSISISLWHKLPPPVNQPISFDNGQLGYAGRCRRANECERAASAVITLSAYDDRRVAGTYVLKFKNGDVESGSFHADWQDLHQICR